MSDIKIKYIDGKKENGIQYDWKFLRKEFQKLGTPKDISQHHLQFQNSMKMVGISCYQKEVLERPPTGYCWV